MQLNDTYLALLRAAAGRHDGLLPSPARLVGAALRRMAARLVALGAAETVPVGADQPIWLRDDAGLGTGLRITEAGRHAIGALDCEELGTPPPAGAEPVVASGDDADAPVRRSTASQARAVQVMYSGQPVCWDCTDWLLLTLRGWRLIDSAR